MKTWSNTQLIERLEREFPAFYILNYNERSALWKALQDAYETGKHDQFYEDRIKLTKENERE